jgi:uncharacterized protein YdeI (YjbR/CyaY-like superfamily)
MRAANWTPERRHTVSAVTIQPTFFATPGAWRRWLARHHDRTDQLWVGFHKRGTGRPSITWPEAVDQALCFGWIDGMRRRIDEQSYMIRFTPRRKGSVWSRVNLARVEELTRLGLMHAAGSAAHRRRTAQRSGIYAYEQRRSARLPPAMTACFKGEPRAWAFFQRQPPWYRQTATWWVVSAKRPETRARRLAILIADSAAGRTIKRLTRPAGAAIPAPRSPGRPRPPRPT